MKKIYYLILLLLMVSTLTACDISELVQDIGLSEPGTTESNDKANEEKIPINFESAMIERVVDGDTVVLSDGKRLRLIGVNTPENTSKQEVYGKEATEFTKSQLEGKMVYLQKDVSETDRYDRLLRYIWLELPTDPYDPNEVEEKMFNAILVSNGFAQPSTYPPDVAYSDLFVELAREAREKQVGLWSYGEDGTTRGDDF